MIPYKKYHFFVYYLAFLFRVFVSNSIKAFPPNNIKENEAEKQRIIEVFKDSGKMNEIIDKCKGVIDKALLKEEFMEVPYREISATIAFETAIKAIVAEELKKGSI